MKLLLAIAATVVLATDSSADNAIDRCKMFEHMAWSIMQARQEAKPISELLSTYAGYGGEMEAVWEWMVRQAYLNSIAKTDELKAQAASEFANKVFLLCYDQ